jgi:hypothetical protein
MYTAVLQEQEMEGGAGGDRFRFSFASFMRCIRNPSRSIQNHHNDVKYIFDGGI